MEALTFQMKKNCGMHFMHNIMEKKDGVLMKKIKQRIMFGNGIRKILFLVGISCTLFGSIAGCGTTKGEYLAKKAEPKHEKSKELFEIITAALEVEDSEAIKTLFSPYALENSENLEEKIQELIEFYPGRNGGYEVWYRTHETTNRGVKECVVAAIFEITNDDEIYRMRITTYTENDVDQDKEGVYMIQVMTKEAEPEGFKWKTETSAPGVYVLE